MSFQRKELIIMKTKRSQDWFNLLLGAWLFASPWLMDYANALPGAAWSAWLCGGAITLLAAAALSVPKIWEEAINALIGAWVVVSPWALGFTSNRDVTQNAVIIGSLVLLLAIWAMLSDQDFRKWRHGGKAGA
jgi:hypothetical protein